MYFVFQHDVKAWRNQILQAQIQGETPPPHIQNQWWTSEPLHNPLLDLKFAINAKAPLLDNFFTGLLLSLYSARLIDYIREVGVQFESFPVTMIDRKTKQTLPEQYALFHLLEMQSGLDKDRSDIDEAKIEIRKLVLTEECRKAKRPLFRLKEYAPVVLMHQDLKDVLESAGISGCKFIPVDEFRVGMRFYFEKIANRERPQN